MRRTTTLFTLLIFLAMVLPVCTGTTGPTEGPTPTSQATPTQEIPVVEVTETPTPTEQMLSYPLVDTGQTACYDTNGAEIACPELGKPLYGQDAQHAGAQPRYTDNGDGTVTDNITGLTWQQTPPAEDFAWQDAADYCANLTLGGYDDWRLPDIKELQSIVDYSRAPGATDPENEGPAIDPVFNITAITNEAGLTDYPYFWTSTSARFQAGQPLYCAWYVAFGRAVDPDGGDVHRAGAVRFDTKSPNGPAGEGGERYYNFVRLMRDIASLESNTSQSKD